ncbi:MAG: hypothetical protein Q9160_007494 [Pyrenula sp. 1 TL-2023]
MNKGRDAVSNDEIAIKLEHHSVDPSFLAGEVHLYEILRRRNGFSKVFWYGQQDDFRIMVFQLLGPSLGDLLYYCGGRFSLKTTLLLFDQLLHRLRDIHKAGYIHRDIKPENFLLGLGHEGNTVYMTDLGLASPYLSQPASQTASLNPDRQHRLVGTCHYASIKAHMDAAPSRRDDLESLGYMVVYFLKGSLPWEHVEESRRENRYEAVLRMKESITAEDLCANLPAAFTEYMKSVRSMEDNEIPDYRRLQQLFRKLFHTEGFKNDALFDWTIYEFQDRNSLQYLYVGEVGALCDKRSSDRKQPIVYLSHVTLSPTRDSSEGSPTTALPTSSFPNPPAEDQIYTDPPPISEASSSNPPSPRPPPFSSLYFPPESELNRIKARVTEAEPSCLPVTAPAPSFEETIEEDQIERAHAETKAALPQDNKGESSGKGVDDGEPPPPYTEGSSPLESFTYVMAAAGGAASIITQVQQTGGPPINTLGAGDVGADEHITLDLRGTRFTLSRDELLTLPEFVLLSLFPNGLLPDGHMNPLHDGDVYPVDVGLSTITLCLANPHIYLGDVTYSSQYDPASLQYMLDFFRTVAQSIPSSTPSPTASPDPDTVPIEPMQGSARDMLQDRAGIIVLREDLDFYVIPPKQDIEQPEMIEVKRAASKALLKQDGIFSGLRRSEEAGTTEQHLIEMLTAGGFDHDDRWGHRAGEPNKAVICSLALARLRTDIKGDMANNNSVGMAQKLLLFWRKPARRCWWEGIELDGVEGVEGPLKVWIRRVWTLEMVRLNKYALFLLPSENFSSLLGPCF